MWQRRLRVTRREGKDTHYKHAVTGDYAGFIAEIKRGLFRRRIYYAYPLTVLGKQCRSRREAKNLLLTNGGK